MIELTSDDIDFLLRVAQDNRENSASLAEMPEQQWKETHKREVKAMDQLIRRLEMTRKIMESQICNN